MSLKRKRTETFSPRKDSRVDEVSNSHDPEDGTKTDGEDVESNDAICEREDESQLVLEDEGEWEGLGVAPAAISTASDQGMRNRDKKLPTGEELRAIKDASDLFKSSSFKLQIDELLPNVRPKPSRVHPLERFLFALHSFLKELAPISPQHPLEASRKLQKKAVAVPYPLPLPTEDTKWKVAFEPPNDITLVGSWANKVSVKAKDDQKFGVDVAVEMPNNLFQEKDYLNGRFFHKRAFYIATIASAIQHSEAFNVDLMYESLGGDPRLTKLVVTPKRDGSPNDFTSLHAKVCILPVLSSHSPIPLHRLSPNHSNIRVNTPEKKGEKQAEAQPPSPLYNSALLQNMAPKFRLLATHELQNDCPAFSDALTLLRIWANQRGYGEGTQMCIRGFEGTGPWWASVFSLLLYGEEMREGSAQTSKRRTVGKGLSSYQLFKAALDFLANHDFETEAVFVKSTENHRYPAEEYQNHPGSVFVDSVSMTNLLAVVPLGSLDLLRYDAKKTLELLNQVTFSGDPFVHVFLKDSRDLLTRFDVILRVNVAAAKATGTSMHATLNAGSPAASLLASINSILRQGYGDRCRAVAILHPPSKPRSLSQGHPLSPDIIFVGIIHNSQAAFRLVEHGPAAGDQDQLALQNFKDLWGDKSELRRFKDGRILESVVWEVATADERALVPSMIARHLLKRHFGLGEDAVETWQSSFDALLRLPSKISREYLDTGIATGFKAALAAFDNLVKNMKSLDKELPLSILTVSPISGALRYTSVFSPVPLPSTLAAILPPNARYLPTIHIILEFEKSSKWPDDLKAVQIIKLAFFERLSTALMQSVNGLTARVVIGDGIKDSLIVDKHFLEIITPDGWAFVAHIWHDREVDLLDRIIYGMAYRLPHVVPKNKEHKKHPDYFEALEAKEVYLRRFIHAPRHHRAIAALCHHYSAFSGTVRLVKRWLASHWLLHGHIGEEVVELICASLFIDGPGALAPDIETEQAGQHLVPGSKVRGFAAAVQFLKEWKWEDGLFVPLYGSKGPTTPAASSTVATTSGIGVWKVRTERDPDGNIWTHKGPDLVVANRVKALANATWDLLCGVENGHFNVQGLFVHPTDDYDFVIELLPYSLPRYLHNVTVDQNLLMKRGKYANKTKVDGNDDVVMPGFDPAQLLFNDLQRIYTDTFKIFSDPFGGDKYGGVWDPTLKDPRSFRVLGGFSSIPIRRKEGEKDKGLVTLNKDSVIAEIERLGSGLIKKITLSW